MKNQTNLILKTFCCKVAFREMVLVGTVGNWQIARIRQKGKMNLATAVDDGDEYRKWEYLKDTNDNGIRKWNNWKLKVGVRDWKNYQTNTFCLSTYLKCTQTLPAKCTTVPSLFTDWLVRAGYGRFTLSCFVVLFRLPLSLINENFCHFESFWTIIFCHFIIRFSFFSINNFDSLKPFWESFATRAVNCHQASC